MKPVMQELELFKILLNHNCLCGAMVIAVPLEILQEMLGPKPKILDCSLCPLHLIILALSKTKTELFL